MSPWHDVASDRSTMTNTDSRKARICTDDAPTWMLHTTRTTRPRHRLAWIHHRAMIQLFPSMNRRPTHPRIRSSISFPRRHRRLLHCSPRRVSPQLSSSSWRLSRLRLSCLGLRRRVNWLPRMSVPLRMAIPNMLHNSPTQMCRNPRVYCSPTACRTPIIASHRMTSISSTNLSHRCDTRFICSTLWAIRKGNNIVVQACSICT